MGQYKKGMPWLRFENHLPRLFLHERNEKRVRWLLRSLTATGVVASVFTLPWYYGLSLSLALVAFDAFFEKTLFYYTSMYVNAMPDFEYDPDKWVANAFVSLGHPADPSSERIVGLVFSDAEYAARFFQLLRAWNHGSTDNKEGSICLSFITDEDAYYVYLYPSFEKASIKNMHEKLEDENKLAKYGKEHFGLIMAMIICKGFSTTHGYALGLFVDNHPVDKPFLLGAFIQAEGGQPQPIGDIEPIRMYRYKAKVPSELNESDFEYQHWRMVVERTALGGEDNA